MSVMNVIQYGCKCNPFTKLVEEQKKLTKTYSFSIFDDNVSNRTPKNQLNVDFTTMEKRGGKYCCDETRVWLQNERSNRLAV